MPFSPVVEEGIRTALRDAARALKIEHAPCATGLDCGPGSERRYVADVAALDEEDHEPAMRTAWPRRSSSFATLW